MIDEKRVFEILTEAANAGLLGKPLPSANLPGSSIATANKILAAVAATGDRGCTVESLTEAIGYGLNTTRSFCRMLSSLGYLERWREPINKRSCFVYRIPSGAKLAH